MRRLLHLHYFILGLAIVAFAQPGLAESSSGYDSEEVTISANGYTLAGTLLLPRGVRRPMPAAILITGSGPQNRDSQVLLPGLENYRPFKQIAEHLAGLGIAVLRVDDRGIGGSTGRETLMTATTSTLADDTRAQITYMRGRREIDPKRIALIGHSEGGSIALMIATTDTRIRAIVLMAAMGKTGKEVNLAQLEEALAGTPGLTEERKAELRKQQREVLRTIMEGGDTSKLGPPASLPWFKEFLSYDPRAFMTRVRQPVLILQGTLDRQVTADHAGLLERAARDGGNKRVAVHVFPDLNHLFLRAKTGAFSEYSKLESTQLGADVLETLGAWLGPGLRAGK
jgi:dipeptidyl aminopeptidase/acylaminoacyl peptidase